MTEPSKPTEQNIPSELLALATIFSKARSATYVDPSNTDHPSNGAEILQSMIAEYVLRDPEYVQINGRALPPQTSGMVESLLAKGWTLEGISDDLSTLVGNMRSNELEQRLGLQLAQDSTLSDPAIAPDQQEVDNSPEEEKEKQSMIAKAMESLTKMGISEEIVSLLSAFINAFQPAKTQEPPAYEYDLSDENTRIAVPHVPSQGNDLIISEIRKSSITSEGLTSEEEPLGFVLSNADFTIPDTMLNFTPTYDQVNAADLGNVDLPTVSDDMQVSQTVAGPLR